MLAGEVEVELLQLERLVGHLQRAALGDNLDGGAQVLKVGALGHVVGGQLDVGSVEDGEDAFDHVDRGLAGAGCAHHIGRGRECRPVERALVSMSAGVVSWVTGRERPPTMVPVYPNVPTFTSPPSSARGCRKVP
jgi:hypothetical protein